MPSEFRFQAALALGLFISLPLAAQHEHDCAKARVATEQNKQMLLPVASVAHQKRMLQYDVNFYKLDVALERNAISVAGNVTINAITTEAAFDTFSFELYQDLVIDSLRLNGQLLPVQRSGGEANVLLTAAMPAGMPVSAQIYYHGTAPSGGSAAIGNGLSTDNSPTWATRLPGA